MKNFLAFVLTAGMAFGAAAAADESDFRTWTDASGDFSFEGKFLRLRGAEVLLEAADGKTRLVPLSRLSEADRDWVKSQGVGESGVSAEDPLTGVAWYSSVEPAFEEARRSRRPIFFMAAATQCSGVPGVF